MNKALEKIVCTPSEAHLFQWSNERHEGVSADDLGQDSVRVVALGGPCLKQFGGHPSHFLLLCYLSKQVLMEYLKLKKYK